MSNKDAEIERLKTEYLMLDDDASEKDAEIERLKALITKLVYVLDGTFRGPVEDLLQRAREATK